MTQSIDLHDTISIIIPGAVAISLVYLFSCGSVDEMMQGAASMDISKSLGFLAFSYVIGAFLQEAGKCFVRHDTIFETSDDPYYWVLKEHVPGDFLPDADCKMLLKMLKIRHSWKKINNEKEALKSCFYPIKIKVYAHDAYRLECIKMLSKLHLFSSLMILSILAPITYALMAGASFVLNPAPCRDMACFCCCSPQSHYSLGEFMAVFFVSSICGRASAQYHRGFNKAYNRCLFSSYLAIMENEQKKKAKS